VTGFPLFLAVLSLVNITLTSGEIPTGEDQIPKECTALQSASDSEIRQFIIQQSIRSYPGSCPCPYNVDRAGRRCGRRSAYSKAGGYAPLCYSEDISNDDVRKFRDECVSKGRQR